MSEQDYRTVKTNSVEHDSLLELGYLPVEQDDTHTILRRSTRATDRPSKPSPQMERWKRIERAVWEQLAEELRAEGVPIDHVQLQWAADQFRLRVMAATSSGRTVVSGRVDGSAAEDVL